MRRTKSRCGQCGAPNDQSLDRCRICGGPMRDMRVSNAPKPGEGASFKESAEHEVTRWSEYADREANIRARHQGVEGLPGPSWFAVLIVLAVGAAVVIAAFNALVA